MNYSSWAHTWDIWPLGSGCVFGGGLVGWNGSLGTWFRRIQLASSPFHSALCVMSWVASYLTCSCCPAVLLKGMGQCDHARNSLKPRANLYLACARHPVTGTKKLINIVHILGYVTRGRRRNHIKTRGPVRIIQGPITAQVWWKWTQQKIAGNIEK